MANIMINDVCNLMCPYCFANKYVNGDTSTDMTYANFKEAVDFVNRANGPERIGIIGGEPLLHHQFTDLLDYALSQRKPEQPILVFTNGILLDKYVDYFAKNQIGLLININSPKDIGHERYKKVVNNIRLARQKGVQASIGINLYKPDLDTTFILDIIDEFAYNECRVGLTAPNSKEKIAEGAFAYHKGIKEALYTFAEECLKRGCRPHLDCQHMPTCIIGPDMDRIHQLEAKYNLPLNGIYDETAACHPVIDILRDLKAVRCFGVSDKEHAVPIQSFNDEGELFDYFATQVDCIGKHIPAEKECEACHQFALGRCQGACLGFKLDKIYYVTSRGNTSK